MFSEPVVFDVLTTTIREVRQTKKIQLGKEEVKISLFEDNMILYIKDLKDINQKTPTANKHI